MDTYRIDKDGRWMVSKDPQREKELDEKADAFERTLGSNKPPKEKK